MSDSAGVTEPPNRSTRQKQKTRARLIQAAMSVMAVKGADAATINDITEAADVGFGSFYNHFASKEDILEAIAADANQQLSIPSSEWRLEEIKETAARAAQSTLPLSTTRRSAPPRP
jgi:AcrR family transcriptional regulator